MSAPHFRIVYPKGFIGQKHRALATVWVTWPGHEEELLTSAIAVEPILAADNVMQVRVTYAASCEIAYTGEDA